MRKKFIYVLWGLLILTVAAIAIIFSAIANGKIGYVPPVEELENPNLKFATQIISDDGQLLGTWSLSKENRVYVGYEDLSPNLVKALIATEDVRFKDHSGIDIRAFSRAVIKRGILMQKHAGGGSTITQQLAKQFYSPTADNVMERLLQKPIEWVIAVKLERYYTKEEILTMYLNKFDFLNNAVGIKTAAKTYFGKDPKDLSVEEAATLIGMCKNPSLYNPRRFNERCRGRRNVVLDQMRKADYLTEAECDSLKALPLTLKFQPVDHKDGLATYFREYLRGIMTAKKPNKSNYRGWQAQQYYEDSIAWETNPLYGWCNKNTKKDGSHYNVYTDGLKIYTTINSRMQRYAEEAVYEHVAQYLQPRFFKEKKGRKTAPYTNQLSEEEVQKILDRSIHQSDRYRTMKEAGYSESEIMQAFNTKHEMQVFSYEGEKDTIMTPLDSIKYYKHFLRAGFMSMDPITGYVKAYVGGPNYNYFQYDMAMVGRRQVGSTIKPYLYTLAMENGFSPCDMTRNVEQTLYDENGKAKQKSVLAKTKAECVEKLKKLQEEYTEVAPFKENPDMRFGDWMNYWYENHCKPSIRPTTQKGYEEWIYVHAIPGLGHIPLNKLTQADCQKFLNEMKANGRKTHRDTKGPEMAERSVRSCYHVIRMALDRAVKDGLIKKNPILGVKLPPPEPKEMKVLSIEEFQRFLIQAKAEGMCELFLLELTTGLRRGEILALTWDDLNFETGELHISKQVTPVGGKNIISEPKTKAAFRTIILPPVMVGLLREYRKEVFSPLMFPSRIKPNQPIAPS